MIMPADKILQAAYHARREKSLYLPPSQLGKFEQILNRNLANSRLRRRLYLQPDVPERDLSPGDRARAMAEARRKIEESSLAAGMVKVMADNIVGSGFRLSMNTKDDGWNRDVEFLWNVEKDKLDVRGVRRWGSLQRMWFVRRFVDGDVGLNMLAFNDKNEERLSTSRVQTIEAERIRKDATSSQDEGIEFDQYGRPVKYFIGPRVTSETDITNKIAQGQPVDARDFILFAKFPEERAERARGFSSMIVNLNMFQDFEELLENMIQTVKNQAFLGLAFKMQAAPDGSIFGNAEETIKDEAGVDRKHVKMVPGMNLNLEPGEDVEMLESKNPNSNFIPFLQFMVRMMGVSTSLPLEILLMDFTGLTFHGGKAMMGLAKRAFSVDQDDLAHPSSRIFQWWLAREIKYNGRLKVPKSIDGMHWLHSWAKPRWPYLQPLQDIQANAMAIDRYMTTISDVVAEHSDRDFDDIVRLRAEENAKLEAAGLPILFGQPGSNVMGGEEKQEVTKTDEDIEAE